MFKFFLAFTMLLALGAGCVPSGSIQAPDEATNEDEVVSICKDTCGNGTCEEIVCQGSGCPCAETADSCPEDCSAETVTHSYLSRNSQALRNVEFGQGFTMGSPVMIVTSPFVVTGEAKGWYFEASFPVTVVDDNGKVIGNGYAQAQSDWMVDEHVPFVATVSFSQPTTDIGKIIFAKDNPSGLPEHDESIEIPVAF